MNPFLRVVPLTLLVIGLTSCAGVSTVSENEKIQVVSEETGFTVTVPVSRLVMQIPRADTLLAQEHPTGGSTNPRYFYFKDERQGLTLSGWFESQGRFSTARKLWDSDTAEWKRQGLPSPTNVSFESLSGWEIVRYNMPVPAGTDTHLRAHWVQAGTWIDLHLSINSEATVAESREKLARLLVSLKIQEKGNPGNQQQGAVPSVSTPPRPATPSTEIPDGPVDVWLVPLDGFPPAMVASLARRLSADLHLNVRASAHTGTSQQMYGANGQMISEQVLRELSPAIARLYDTTPKTAFIMLTVADLNGADGTTRFVFASHFTQRKSVVSLARLRDSFFGQLDRPNVTEVRLYKIVKKSIGLQYYELPRSTKMESVMYSPIMSLDDLDAIGTAF